MLRACFLLVSVLWVSCVSGELIHCTRLRELLPLVDKDTLVVFNINNVLTVSSQDAGSTPWAEEQIAKIMTEKGIDKAHATNLFIPLWHDILIASDVELFDPDAEAIVHHLQEQGIKVMALTNRYTEMAYPTHRNCRSVGIDFAKNPPHAEDTWVNTDSPAKYVEGILFNGLINFKGDSLAAFLKQISYTPKKVIYIEDKPKHLAQVEKKVSALGIPFVGVHFGALEAQRESYCRAYAELQVRYHQDLVDDASAKRICRSRGCNAPTDKPIKNATWAVPINIQTIESIQELKNDLIPNTLVVTELDQVLWETAGSIGARAFFDYVEARRNHLGDSPRLARLKAERLFEKIHRRAQVSLIEPNATAFFDMLPSLNCWSIAVTYRPSRLSIRTAEQATSVGLKFHSPFETKEPFQVKGFIFSTATDAVENFEEQLSHSKVRPAQLLCVSSSLEDLQKLQKVAERQQIPFQGRLLISPKAQVPILDDDIIDVELEHLDHLIVNAEAAMLTELCH